jgi:mRNA-degrading endonuclease RelE of RelBE toxin-antitoxin system
MYKIILKKSAHKALQKLPKNTRIRIAFAIEDLRRSGIGASQVKQLHGPLSGFRKRVGGFRILFDVNKKVILIHRITKRDKAY